MSIITVEQESLFDMLPTASGCKDLDSKFIYANQYYADIIGFKDKEDVIGRTDFDMPCDTVNCADMFRDQDHQVIVKLITMRILDIHPFAGGEWKAYVFSKSPLYDHEKKISGTIFSGQDVTNASTLELAALLTKIKVEGVTNDLLGQDSYMIGTKFGEIKLTNRESEVLFFILRGKTAKIIAKTLSISYRTVEKYFDSLKYKFCADNLCELVDKSISLGYLNIIPETLFTTQISFCLSNN